MVGVIPILLLLVPSFFVGWLVLDRMRRPFNDDPDLMKRVFRASPMTVIAACTVVGSGLVWVVLTVLGVW